MTLRLTDLTLKERLTARENGISDATLRHRLRNGWDKERAITEPVEKWKKYYELAKKNGIPINTFRWRIYTQGLHPKVAATKPLRHKQEKVKWAEVAEKKGINKRTFFWRVNNGWDYERAATELPGRKKVTK